MASVFLSLSSILFYLSALQIFYSRLPTRLRFEDALLAYVYRSNPQCTAARARLPLFNHGRRWIKPLEGIHALSSDLYRPSLTLLDYPPTPTIRPLPVPLNNLLNLTLLPPLAISRVLRPPPIILITCCGIFFILHRQVILQTVLNSRTEKKQRR